MLAKRTTWVLLGVLGLAGPSRASEVGQVSDARDPDGVRTASTRLVIEGHVLEPDGRAAEGAVVVTSAGGQALTDARGGFVLDVEVPLDAESLQITVAGRAGTNLLASRNLALSTTNGRTQVDALQLARVLTCVPRWLPTFGGQPGTDGNVNALLVFDDGEGPALYVGGDFSTAGGAAALGIAKWDGSSWSTVGASPGFVQALLVFDDGSGPALHAGGTFGVSKWDGSSWSAAGAGLDDTVQTLAVFDDGDGPALYAGGVFTGKIAKRSGSSWSIVGGGVVTGNVRALTVLDDGSGAALYAGGTFSFVGGVSARRVARWDGASWSGLANGVNEDVEALAAFDDGGGPKLYVGGRFSMASGVSASRIARWDGASWSALGAGMNGTVHGLTSFDDGGGSRLYATGDFSSAGGAAAANLARWNGSSWSALGSGVGNTGIHRVEAMEVFDDGSGPALYVGGVFTLAGGSAANNVARWDGSSWSALGSGTNNSVLALKVFDDGSGPALYAGGTFTSAGGGSASRIARWDGTSSFAPRCSSANHDARDPTRARHDPREFLNRNRCTRAHSVQPLTRASRWLGTRGRQSEEPMLRSKTVRSSVPGSCVWSLLPRRTRSSTSRATATWRTWWRRSWTRSSRRS